MVFQLETHIFSYCIFYCYLLVYEYNRRLYSQGGLAGNDLVFFSTLFVQAGVSPPVNNIEYVDVWVNSQMPPIFVICSKGS